MEVKEYLESLSPEQFTVVSAHITRDKFGLPHPDGGTVCDPPCSGSGPTPNGHWVCSSGTCHWVPDIG